MNRRYKYCFKEEKFVQYDAHNSEETEETEEKLSEIKFGTDNCTVLTETASIYMEINKFFCDLPSELRSLNLTQTNYKKSIDLVINIVEETQQICSKLVKKNCAVSENIEKTIGCGFEHVLSKLKEIDNADKLKKVIHSKPTFVEPIAKSIGLKWKNAKVNPETQLPDHGLVQSTFYYVPILESLKSAFENTPFYEKYKKYNLHEKHKCVNGVYEDFCCGSVSKSKDIFENPLTIQLQLGNDDFEVCCPVKTKANKHKINATYVQIKNMPIEYRSKLENIYLVCLCSTLNIKSDNYDYNHIAELIVEEIKKLETDGLKIDKDIIKGTLINIACDNLGANTVLGFVESFVAHYFCRYCECTKEETKSLVKENKRKRRKKRDYENHVKRAENIRLLPDFKASKGVKKKCTFNELKNYHILDNMSFDVMHDFNEGVIAYCIYDFFHLIVKKKIFSESEIQRRVRDFNYGNTHKNNKPSLVNMDKKNLNQNATQFYCLMVNLPLIFLDKKADIEPYWQPVQTLLKCMQIIYSPKIMERDVKRLEKYIEQHLQAMIDIFGRNLTAKHHFLLHYPEFIRRMGPPIHLWTMRLESKHKVLTEIARRKMNFINLPKTLAFEHQERMCKQPVFSTKIKLSDSSGQFNDNGKFGKYENMIRRDVVCDLDRIRSHKFAMYDNIEYRNRSILIEKQRVYEIVGIISTDSETYFVCDLYKVCHYDNFCNTLEIQKIENSSVVINFNSIENKIAYDKMYADEKNVIIADKLIIGNLI